MLGSSLDFLKTTSFGSLNISESNNQWFQFFKMFWKAKITNFSYFKNLKESMVFTREQQKTSGSLANIWCCIEPWLHIILNSLNILKTNGYVVIYQRWWLIGIYHGFLKPRNICRNLLVSLGYFWRTPSIEWKVDLGMWNALSQGP